VVLIGDSIFMYLTTTPLWDEAFEPLHTLNLSIGGDATQHCLWRLENGTLGNVRPKVAAILLGTNNLNFGHTVPQIVEGIIKVCTTVHEKLPDTEVLLMTLLPRGHKPNPIRETLATVNSLIKKEAEKLSYVQLVPCGELLQQDGSISHRDMYDYLHPTPRGYSKFLAPLLEQIKESLRGDDKAVINQIANSVSTSNLPTPEDQPS